MNRTTRGRTSTLAEFIAGNRRLLVFLSLFLLGVLGGAMVFAVSHGSLTRELSLMLDVPAVTEGFKGGISILYSSCFSTMVLLLILFLSGMSTCGAPLTALVPLFFGLGVGLTEAYYYGSGWEGLLFTAVLVVPHSLLAAAALIMGCSESLRLSLLLSEQLLPSAAHCGGLWQDFRLYCIRFLLFFALAFGAGVLDVCLRLLCASWFSSGA